MPTPRVEGCCVQSIFLEIIGDSCLSGAFICHFLFTISVCAVLGPGIDLEGEIAECFNSFPPRSSYNISLKAFKCPGGMF